ncbi:MAG: SMP-30/gluconolactonase/LRE family protein [Pseudomonadota bacterium]|nr:SMP-30/gluconolactonase/LRE family protein [Pseudomonadota bacterium]
MFCTTVRIEGDYVESFIYSGTLFLFDSDAKVILVDWQALVEFIVDYEDLLKNHEISGYIIGGESLSWIPDEDVEYYVDIETLRSFIRQTLDLGSMASDVELYSNKMYVTSERGVSRWDFDWKSKNIRNNKFIYQGLCFSVSANSYNRVAFSAGHNGAFYYSDVKGKDIFELSDDVCVSLDWLENRAVVKSESKCHVFDFQPIPSKNRFNDNNYWESVNDSKLIFNEREDFSLIDSSGAFLLGDQLCELRDGNVWDVGANSLLHQFNRDFDRVDAVKAFALGVAIESSGGLYVLNDQILLLEEFINWRVFPRAKNYGNQIHLICEDCLSVKTFPFIEGVNFRYKPKSFS